MASKKDIQEMLVSMTFQPTYIQRAFKVYEKNYGRSYNVEVITEIIVLLQNKDKIKLNRKKSGHAKDKHAPKEPPTSFMLFADEIRPHVQSEYPNTRSGPLLKIIDQKWRALSDEEKASYQKEADRLREHANTNNQDTPPWTQIEEHDVTPFVSHMTMEDAMKLSVHDKIDHRDLVGRFVFATVSEKQGSKLKIHYHGWSRKWDTWSDFSVELHRFAVSGSISLRPSHRTEFKRLKKGDYVDINPSQRHFGWKVGEIRRLDAKSGQVQVVYAYLDKNYVYWAHLDNVDEIASFGSESSSAKTKEKEVVQNKEEEEDETEASNRIRSKRFPRYANEEISNKYDIGEWLEVQDTQNLHWFTAIVIDKENNWICVHFDGWPSKYDQKIHVIKHACRLRTLGAEFIREAQQEHDISAKRFPRHTDEEIRNKYDIGEWLEVQETKTLQWIPVTVIDKENNWICVYYNGFENNEKIHVIRDAHRLRALGINLEPAERKQKQKMKNKTRKRKLEEIQSAYDLNEPQHKKSKPNSENKSKMSVKEVANWIGSLGSAYQQYVKPCIDNAMDGSLLEELNEDSLSEMVNSKIHRKKIMLEWYKL